MVGILNGSRAGPLRAVLACVVLSEIVGGSVPAAAQTDATPPPAARPDLDPVSILLLPTAGGYA